MLIIIPGIKVERSSDRPPPFTGHCPLSFHNESLGAAFLSMSEGELSPALAKPAEIETCVAVAGTVCMEIDNSQTWRNGKYARPWGKSPRFLVWWIKKVRGCQCGDQAVYRSVRLCLFNKARIMARSHLLLLSGR